ncbi:hypothetical protein ACQ4WX_47235 [Streptomyces lasalocidi]
MLDRGPVPRRAAPWPADSLGRLDACTLLDPAALERVPGLRQRPTDRGFADWTCDWASPDGQHAYVKAQFTQDNDLSDNGRPARIAGTTSYVSPKEALMFEDVQHVTVVGNTFAAATDHAIVLAIHSTGAHVHGNRTDPRVRCEVGVDASSRPGYRGPTLPDAPARRPAPHLSVPKPVGRGEERAGQHDQQEAHHGLVTVEERQPPHHADVPVGELLHQAQHPLHESDEPGHFQHLLHAHDGRARRRPHASAGRRDGTAESARSDRAG